MHQPVQFIDFTRQKHTQRLPDTTIRTNVSRHSISRSFPRMQPQTRAQFEFSHGLHDICNGLRYFLEVAKCKSIPRASERQHVAASAISRQISPLEHELDCVLLDRRSNGVSLSEAGERLWALGLQIEAQVQSDIDDLRALHRGAIRITTVEGITENFLPSILTEFNQLYPDVTFEITSASRDETVNALDRYEADIGFFTIFRTTTRLKRRPIVTSL